MDMHTLFDGAPKNGRFTDTKLEMASAALLYLPLSRVLRVAYEEQLV